MTLYIRMILCSKGNSIELKSSQEHESFKKSLKESLKEIPQDLEESDSPHGGGCGYGAVIAGNQDKDGGCHHHEILYKYFMYWY